MGSRDFHSFPSFLESKNLKSVKSNEILYDFTRQQYVNLQVQYVLGISDIYKKNCSFILTNLMRCCILITKYFLFNIEGL